VSTVPAIPDHALLRTIGRGAYGEVWLARNVMGTLRAVKIIWRRQFDSARPFERELAGIQRYEPVSRSSGGLVHVLHVGKNDAESYFYYVMELADDAAGSEGVEESADKISNAYEPRTLRSDLKRLGRLPTSDCLRLAIEAASGLAQLHRHGLIHRDVKPGNIIFVNRRAKLADIGLVTAEGEGRTFVGTEGYIPPEGPGTPAADLYALGVVLYEASTGFPPDRLPDVPPQWLADRAGDEALELHEVILKACEGQRERRYADIESLQADLALLQSGQSVRRVRALEKRYARLRRAGFVGTTLLVIAVIAALFASYRERLAAESNAREIALRQNAQESQARAESAERQARQQLYSALLEQARATVRSGELGQRVHAIDAIRRAAAISNTAELRGAAMAAMALPDWRFEREWPKTSDTTTVQLDPMFERLALCCGSGPVEIRTVSDQKLLATLPASTNLPAYAARWSADGQFLAVKRDWHDPDDVADLEVWNVAQQRRVLLAPAIKHAMAFHPRLPRIMAALRDGGVAVWDLQKGVELERFKLQEVPIVLAFSPDGERFAGGCEGSNAWTACIYRAADGFRLVSHKLDDVVGAIDWHPDGRWLAIADFTGVVQMFDTETGDSRLLGRHKVQAVLAQFTPDGNYLLTAGWEREFICWNARRMARAFEIHLDSYRAQFRADGGECAILTDSNVQLHAIERPGGCREFSEEMGPRLLHAAFSPDGRWLAASASQRIGVWDLSRHDDGATSQQGAAGRLFFSSQGELFASTDGLGYRWHLATAAKPGLAPQLDLVSTYDLPDFASVCVASNQVVLTAQKGSCVLSPSASSMPQRNWSPTVYGFSGSSPDGQWLGIYPSYSPSLSIYRLPGFNPVAKLTTSGSIAAVEFSPWSDEVAVCTSRSLETWSTSSWQPLRQLNFIRLLYSPDARTLWLTANYSTAGLYDAKTLKLLLPLPLGERPIAISADGRLLATSVDTRRLQVWNLLEVRRQLKELGLDW
jgi:serine/threonine protein kinase/WD40 repeat protein